MTQANWLDTEPPNTPAKPAERLQDEATAEIRPVSPAEAERDAQSLDALSRYVAGRW